MIDFKQGFVKLAPVTNESMQDIIMPMLTENEQIFACFKSVRDSLIFTNKRAIAINKQGMGGKKIDYTSLPYSKVQAFSIETSGMFDRDCEIELYFSALGNVRFEIKGNFDIVSFNKILSHYVL